jgi:hypothetical protein
MSNIRFPLFDAPGRILGRGARTSATDGLWPLRLPFVRPLSLQETINRASVYVIGIVALCGVTYLCLYMSDALGS